MTPPNDSPPTNCVSFASEESEEADEEEEEDGAALLEDVRRCKRHTTPLTEAGSGVGIA
eukprot:CAMPEP_0176440862 /NCGR_PEP_ID=MMETSP0127-20121128/20836_1 /TAXON_ID=938130 /ORGANISM="Platyophrya macrostoma, Strain WH" /LENGTH=58 /DNA_ID=CAMNT_0017825493 /DNA_START=124 /DNA_END=297 /DNA_ORIENTATION=-